MNEKKFLLVPDSFKGSISSIEICKIMTNSIKKQLPNAKVISLPVADGGEGTVEAMLSACGGKAITKEVCSVFENEKINAQYGILTDNKTAIIEVATCDGLPLVMGRENPLEATTFGVGQLILDAISKGATKIIVGLGGTASNDMGFGMLTALGCKFYDKNSTEFMPKGKSLNEITKIDMSQLNKKLDGIEIVCMCDVENPPYGENGASYIFAPQKGASKSEVEFLDCGVKHCCDLIKSQMNIDLSTLKGGGAAGAMGVAMYLLKAQMKLGIDVVLETTKFDSLVADTDFVFTGEGKFDSQSMKGKVINGIINHTANSNAKVIAVVGDISAEFNSTTNFPMYAIFSINRLAKPFKEVKKMSKDDLRLTMDNIVKLINC